MGGIGGGSSKSGDSGSSGGGASFGSYVGPALQGAKLGLNMRDLEDSKKNTKRQLWAIRQQQEVNRNRQKNILEEQLASRRARLGSMGISSSGSATASQNKMIEDAYNNIAEDDNLYNSKYSEFYNNYQSNLRKKIMDGALDATNKVLK